MVVGLYIPADLASRVRPVRGVEHDNKSAKLLGADPQDLVVTSTVNSLAEFGFVCGPQRGARPNHRATTWYESLSFDGGRPFDGARQVPICGDAIFVGLSPTALGERWFEDLPLDLAENLIRQDVNREYESHPNNRFGMRI